MGDQQLGLQDAEANSGTGSFTTNRGIAWWFDLGPTTLGVYGANTAFPSSASPGPANRGVNFFLGGTATSSILQRIDIADLAADIDGRVDYVMSGWLGGAGSQEDGASLMAKFLDYSGAVLGSNTLRRVTAAERANATGLLHRSATGALPHGTRQVEFTLTLVAGGGLNDASADNLSFLLTPPVPVITALEKRTNGWQVTFTTSSVGSYLLERSDNLSAWSGVAPPVPGTGQSVVATDTNAPAGQAFYRVINEF